MNPAKSPSPASKAEFSAGISPSEVTEKYRETEPPTAAEAAASGKQTCKVPGCGAEVRDLERHMAYACGVKKDQAHLLYSLKQTKAASPSPEATADSEDPPLEEAFGEWEGRFLVGIIVEVVKARYGDKVVIPESPEDPRGKPGEAWMEKAGEVHQSVLNRYVGPRLRQHRELAFLAGVWFQFYMVNQAAFNAEKTPPPGSEYLADRHEETREEHAGRKADDEGEAAPRRRPPQRPEERPYLPG